MAELARILIVDDNPKYLEDISVDCIGTKMYSYQKDNIIKLYNNLTEDNPDTDISLRVKDKLSSFGLDLDYVGCKIIIDLCNIAPVNGITVNTDYDTICKLFLGHLIILFAFFGQLLSESFKNYRTKGIRNI